MGSKKVRGKLVKRYIELLSLGEFTISEVAAIIGTDYYTAKSMINYILRYHEGVLIEKKELGNKYSVNKEVLKSE